MIPVLFHIGRFAVPTHDFFSAVGLVVASWIVITKTRRSGRMDLDMWCVVAGALVGAMIGARLATVWSYLASDPSPSLRGYVIAGGKSVLGGLPGAYLGVLVAKRLVGMKRSTGDLFAPGAAIGIAIGRVGCLLTENIGTPTSLPWGISVSAAAARRIPDCTWCAPGVRMHPSMLYEIIFHLAAFALMIVAAQRFTTEGTLFRSYVFAYAVFRFSVEFVRGSPHIWIGLSRPQLVLAPTLLVTVAYMAYRHLNSTQPTAAFSSARNVLGQQMTGVPTNDHSSTTHSDPSRNA